MKEIKVKANITIREAMKVLDRTAEKCLLVIDDNNKLFGTLTDGDLRRSILGGIKFSEPISSSCNTKPKVLFKENHTRSEAMEIMRKYKIGLIPILNKNNIIVDYITWSSLTNDDEKKQKLNVPVVIMAGGRGARLEPFTKVLPKPLVPIQEKPIIEHIIERFNKIGCSEFHLTVNYKGKILKAYFEELKPDYNIFFIDEHEPLGTAGSLYQLNKKFSEPIFVTNCDIIIKSDYKSIYDFHVRGNYDVTLVASIKEYVIPYGTCELNLEGHLAHINEKPKYEFLINTGLYILNPEILKLIPENKFYHITHLIENVKNKGKRVGVFPIDEDAWIDVGQWTEYKQAIQRLL